jgi:hypothetical protein
VQRTLAEELQGLGVSESDAQKGFVRVAGQSGLSAGTGDTASQDVLIDANLKQSAAAQDAVTRSASARVNRFEGGGAFAGDRKGTAGIGSASS